MCVCVWVHAANITSWMLLRSQRHIHWSEVNEVLRNDGAIFLPHLCCQSSTDLPESASASTHQICTLQPCKTFTVRVWWHWEEAGFWSQRAVDLWSSRPRTAWVSGPTNELWESCASSISRTGSSSTLPKGPLTSSHLHPSFHPLISYNNPLHWGTHHRLGAQGVGYLFRVLYCQLQLSNNSSAGGNSHSWFSTVTGLQSTFTQWSGVQRRPSGGGRRRLNLDSCSVTAQKSFP